MKRYLDYLMLSVGGLLGLAWAIKTAHFPMDWFELDYLIDLSSLFTVASFSVRGMLPLRALAIASQIVAIPYFLLQPTPLWTPVGWTGLFLLINLYHVVHILLEKRPVKLSPDEQQLYDLTFATFGQRDFLKLVKLGKWKTASKGDTIYTRGDPVTQILVPIVGAVSARLDEKESVNLVPGEFIGANVVFTNRLAIADMAFAEDARYVCWSLPEIQEFLDKNPELVRNFNEIVHRHLVRQINKLALKLSPGKAA